MINPATEHSQAFTADAVITNPIPDVDDTGDSQVEILAARVENLEILRAVAERDRRATDDRAASDLAKSFSLTGAQIQAIRTQWQGDRDTARKADEAEANARTWFITGIVLATLGGVIGTVAQTS